MQKVIITCHGYTGYPSEMEPFGSFFEDHGYTWINLTLPGHGTSEEELKKTTWRMWVDYVDKQVTKQLKIADYVVFAGLSLGGAVTLYALENHPTLAAGIALAPPYRILTGWHRLLKYLPFLNFWISKSETEANDILDPVDEKHISYPRHHTQSVRQLDQFVTRVRDNLSLIKQPLMIIHGTRDRVIPVDATTKLAAVVSSVTMRTVLVKAGHVLTLEKLRETWFGQALEFSEAALTD